AASQVIQFLEDGSMPPGDRPRPTDEEVDILKKWVAANAPSYPVAFDDDTTLRVMFDDLETHAADAPHLRYFSFAHLVREDGPVPDLRAEEGKLHRALVGCGVKKPPEPVDDTATLFRFDTRKAGWDRREQFPE